MAEPVRRRRRPAVSCTLCRRRKLKCNRESPCSNCTKSRNAACIYEDHPPLAARQPSKHTTLNPGEAAIAPGHSPGSISSETSTAPANASSSAQTTSTKVSAVINQPLTPVSNIGREASENQLQVGGPDLLRRPQFIGRSIVHKSRLFGQSHWCNGIDVFQDIFEMIEPAMLKEPCSTLSGIRRCKALAKTIKTGRSPPWPVTQTSALPPRDIADSLVDCYLRTIETVYRILHVPTFKRDYETLWLTDAQPSAAFLVQVKLIFAIGAVTYDGHFSLRTSAIQWMYEAQMWASVPNFKSNLGIQFLQINILLLIAREIVDIAGELTWISVGSLLRTAVYMGLHRDPAGLPKGTVFAAEMRRRLWNTILEISLQSSMSSGGPAFVSLGDFNTEPPGNIDDEQLMADKLTFRSSEHYTQMSVARALRETWPQRLTVAKFLNDLNSQVSYDEVLRLDADLRASYKTLRHSLHGNASSDRRALGKFELRILDFIMTYYLSAIHIPFFEQALRGTAYAFSRKVLVENSLKIWYMVHPPSATTTNPLSSDMDITTEDDDFARLVACGHTLFRTIAFQTCCIIAAELRAQLQEHESLGPTPVRPDLLAALYNGKKWTLHCIKVGETNFKGYLLLSMISAQIEGLMQGRKLDEYPAILIQASERAVETCLPILQEQASKFQAVEAETQLAQPQDVSELTGQADLLQDWDFSSAESHFVFDDLESMNWVFDGSDMQQLPHW